MEIKLTIEIKKPKDTHYDSVLAAVHKESRPLVDQLREFAGKTAHPLVSTHSDWALEINESDWSHELFGDTWCFDVSIYLKIAEVDSGDVVDEFLAWELLGEPIDKQVFEPLHSCDWSGLQGREEVSLLFSSLKAMHSSKKDSLYFHYDVITIQDNYLSLHNISKDYDQL